MRLEHLHYITTINRYHSITRAADALYISQPALSRALSAVEEELGTQLFERTKQGVSPTPIGEQLLPYFKEIEEKMEAVYQILAINHDSDIKAALRISAGAILCNNILPKAIHLFNQSYPSIDVDIYEEYDVAIANSICSSKADIGFLTISPHINGEIFQLLDKNNLSYRRLLQTSMIALISAESLLANESLITAEQLSTQVLIMNKKTKPRPPADTLSNQQIFYYTSTSMRDKMILANQGLAIVSTLEMYDDYYLQQGLMLAKPLAEDALIDTFMQLWLVYNERALTFYENDFINIFYKLLHETTT